MVHRSAAQDLLPSSRAAQSRFRFLITAAGDGEAVRSDTPPTSPARREDFQVAPAEIDHDADDEPDDGRRILPINKRACEQAIRDQTSDRGHQLRDYERRFVGPGFVGAANRVRDLRDRCREASLEHREDRYAQPRVICIHRSIFGTFSAEHKNPRACRFGG
jgi:hypothetical protein